MVISPSPISKTRGKISKAARSGNWIPASGSFGYITWPGTIKLNARDINAFHAQRCGQFSGTKPLDFISGSQIGGSVRNLFGVKLTPRVEIHAVQKLSFIISP